MNRDKSNVPDAKRRAPDLLYARDQGNVGVLRLFNWKRKICLLAVGLTVILIGLAGKCPCCSTNGALEKSGGKETYSREPVPPKSDFPNPRKRLRTWSDLCTNVEKIFHSHTATGPQTTLVMIANNHCRTPSPVGWIVIRKMNTV